MHDPRRVALASALVTSLAFLGTPARAAFPDPPGEESSAKPTTVVERLTAEAAKLRPLIKTDAGRAMLDAAKSLPNPGKRTIYRSDDRLLALNESQFRALPEERQKDLKPRAVDSVFYYYTGYGSPLISARAFDLLAAAAKWDSFSGKRILDFGYGSIGQGRLLASLGADYTGIEVEPMLAALYSEPGDTGAVGPGKLRLLNGRWPADKPVVESAGEGYDLFISKNTLKRGYIHPAREVDPKYLVHLGVDDETFLNNVHRVLKPGGYALIYNISPAQNAADSGKPYLPHADGQSPFTREQFQKAGFEVLEFDHPETDTALDIWMALGINGEKTREEQAKDLFAWYTLVRKPLQPAKP